MERKSTDIFIVGAGAGGASLGYLLKKAGRDVLLLEMLDYQKKNKLCAGILEYRSETAFSAIFGKTVDEAGLATMNLDEFVVRYDGYEMRRAMSGRNEQSGKSKDDDNSGHGSMGKLAELFKKGGKFAAKAILKQAIGYEPGHFAFRALPRKSLDDYVVRQYLSLGGDLLDKTTIQSIDEDNKIAVCINLATKEKFEIKYNVIVGADGAASTVRRLLTGKRQVCSLALEAAVPMISQSTIIYYAPELHGYFWYIPRGVDATVGCVYHKLGDNNSAKCRELFSSCCADMGIKGTGKLRGALISQGDDVLLQPGCNGAYLIGEAAGLTDYFTGGGIHYALWSAKCLADALVEGKSYEKLMEPYVKAVKKNRTNANLFFKAGTTVVLQLGSRRQLDA